MESAGPAHGYAGWAAGPDLASYMPAWEKYEQAGIDIFRPSLLLYLLLISCTYKLIYNVYISHNKGVLWYTRGYIPDRRSWNINQIKTFSLGNIFDFQMAFMVASEGSRANRNL
jgi:hypothetical protein